MKLNVIGTATISETRAPRPRKILYSPGYGAGWTTWHMGPPDQQEFMLSYEPFIEALEARPEGEPKTRTVAFTAAAVGGEAKLYEGRVPTTPQMASDRAAHYKRVARVLKLPRGGRVLWEVSSEEVPEDLPVGRFLIDWLIRFGTAEPPLLYGLRDLAVYEVGSAEFTIRENDGSERVALR